MTPPNALKYTATDPSTHKAIPNPSNDPSPAFILSPSTQANIKMTPPNAPIATNLSTPKAATNSSKGLSPASILFPSTQSNIKMTPPKALIATATDLSTPNAVATNFAATDHYQNVRTVEALPKF